MWTAQFETSTDVPAATLFRAIADVNSWSKWDTGLEYTRLDGDAKAGARFTLKPRGVREAPTQIAAFVAYAQQQS